MATANVAIFDGTHSGGTKFYQIIYLEAPPGQRHSNVLVFRWGKIGAAGQIDAFVGDVWAQAMVKRAEKEKRGYRFKRDDHQLDGWGPSLPTIVARHPAVIAFFQRLNSGARQAEDITSIIPTVAIEIDRSKDELWGTW